MKPFTFALMIVAQRVDEALRLERLRSEPNPRLLAGLSSRKRRLGTRLRRSFAQPALTRS